MPALMQAPYTMGRRKWRKQKKKKEDTHNNGETIRKNKRSAPFAWESRTCSYVCIFSFFFSSVTSCNESSSSFRWIVPRKEKEGRHKHDAMLWFEC
jgi:hypothetical protein